MGVVGVRAEPESSRTASQTCSADPYLESDHSLPGSGHQAGTGLSEDRYVGVTGDAPSRVGWIVVGDGGTLGMVDWNGITEEAFGL